MDGVVVVAIVFATYAISAYHTVNFRLWRGVIDTAFCVLTCGRLLVFFGYSGSYDNKTNRRDVT